MPTMQVDGLALDFIEVVSLIHSTWKQGSGPDDMLEEMPFSAEIVIQYHGTASICIVDSDATMDSGTLSCLTGAQHLYQAGG